MSIKSKVVNECQSIFCFYKILAALHRIRLLLGGLLPVLFLLQAPLECCGREQVTTLRSCAFWGLRLHWKNLQIGVRLPNQNKKHVGHGLALHRSSRRQNLELPQNAGPSRKAQIDVAMVLQGFDKSSLGSCNISLVSKINYRLLQTLNVHLRAPSVWFLTRSTLNFTTWFVCA